MILKIALFDFLQKQHNVFYVRLVVTEKDNSLLEMRNKFSRNRQILSSNWQQAEDEVGLVDIERFRDLELLFNSGVHTRWTYFLINATNIFKHSHLHICTYMNNMTIYEGKMLK